jgi:thymidine phosphorylase
MEKYRLSSAKKSKSDKIFRKNMFILFMDRKGMILTHAVPRGQTVNADYYCKVCKIIIKHCLGGVSHCLNLMLVVVVSSVKRVLNLASGPTEQKTSGK